MQRNLPIRIYEALLKENKLKPDQSQRKAVELLTKLSERLDGYSPKPAVSPGWLRAVHFIKHSD